MATERGGAYAIIFGGKKNSLAFLLGQPKNFGRHPMIWVSWMAIEILQSPFNNGVMSMTTNFFLSPLDTPQLFDGDQKGMG
jgi:hypothetical protein